MRYTVEELHDGRQVIGRDVPAATDYLAVARTGRRPGMYRTAASAEPGRRYFWPPPHGRLEPMDC